MFSSFISLFKAKKNRGVKGKKRLRNKDVSARSLRNEREVTNFKISALYQKYGEPELKADDFKYPKSIPAEWGKIFTLTDKGKKNASAKSLSLRMKDNDFACFESGWILFNQDVLNNKDKSKNKDEREAKKTDEERLCEEINSILQSFINFLLEKKEVQSLERQVKIRFQPVAFAPNLLFENEEGHKGLYSSDQDSIEHEWHNIIKNANDEGVSDIHFLVRSDGGSVSYRKNGSLNLAKTFSAKKGKGIISSLMAVSRGGGANFNEFELQSAQIDEDVLATSNLEMPKGLHGMRLQYNPLAFGSSELIVRLFNQTVNPDEVSLSSLGFLDEQIKILEDQRRRPAGAMIICGPVAHGKSTTLALLMSITYRDAEKSNKGISIIAIADPAEQDIIGVRQIPVYGHDEVERAKSFKKAQSATLRSDMNVLCVNEIRDGSSANTLLNAALSGHPTYASIHAERCHQIPKRLLSVGADMELLWESGVLRCLGSQRLIGKLCNRCKKTLTVEEAVLDEKATDKHVRDVANRLFFEDRASLQISFANNDGCAECSHGYKGRNLIAELMSVTPKIREALREDSYKARRIWLEEDSGVSMDEHAIRLIKQQEISLVDAINMCGEEALIDASDLIATRKLAHV